MCCSFALLSSWFLCWAAALDTEPEVGQGLTYFLDFKQMLKYFMVVLVLPMPNLQHRDPKVTARLGAKGRQDSDSSKEVLLFEGGTLSQ